MKIINGNEIILKNLDVDKSQGTFYGLASTYGNEDSDGDIMADTAFDKMPEGLLVPVFHEHLPSNKIGEGRLYKVSQGLSIEGKLYIKGSNLDAKKVYENLISAEYEHKPSFSIGFRVKKYDSREEKGFIFKEVELLETSFVSIPANPQAVLIGAKSADRKRAIEKALKNVGYSNSQSKKAASILEKSLHEEQREVVKIQRDADIYKELTKFLTKIN